MAFGIPGDAVTAVMLGALTIHGIQSGPLFISPPSCWCSA
jgi:putative tricarboxylic transport membrane protein